jgi:hypothetical protein
MKLFLSQKSWGVDLPSLVDLPEWLPRILTDDQKARIRNCHPGDTLTIRLPDGTTLTFDITEENRNQLMRCIAPGGAFTLASAAHEAPPMAFSAATCSYIGDIRTFDQAIFPNGHEAPPIEPASPALVRRLERDREKGRRKHLKAEAKAQEMLRNFIGAEQWAVYRKTNRVIIKPNKRFWIIGNYFGHYNKATPFFGKPDVIRIDNDKKLHITEFCVDQSGGEQTPFTDKVIFFASHLCAAENEFIKLVNRIGERTLNEIKECAIWAN